QSEPVARICGRRASGRAIGSKVWILPLLKDCEARERGQSKNDLHRACGNAPSPDRLRRSTSPPPSRSRASADSKPAEARSASGGGPQAGRGKAPQYFAEIGNSSAGNSEIRRQPLSVTTTSSSMRAAEKPSVAGQYVSIANTMPSLISVG